jgi:hypothetical protein
MATAAQTAILASLRAMQQLSNAVGNTEEVIAAATPSVAGVAAAPCPPGGRTPMVVLKTTLADGETIFGSSQLTAMWLSRADGNLLVTDSPLVIVSKVALIPDTVKNTLAKNTRSVSVQKELDAHFKKARAKMLDIQKALRSIVTNPETSGFDDAVARFFDDLLRKLVESPGESVTKVTKSLSKAISTTGTSRATADLQDSLMAYFADDIRNAIAIEKMLMSDPVIAEACETQLRRSGDQTIPRVLASVDPADVNYAIGSSLPDSRIPSRRGSVNVNALLAGTPPAGGAVASGGLGAVAGGGGAGAAAPVGGAANRSGGGGGAGAAAPVGGAAAGGGGAANRSGGGGGAGAPAGGAAAGVRAGTGLTLPPAGAGIAAAAPLSFANAIARGRAGLRPTRPAEAAAPPAPPAGSLLAAIEARGAALRPPGRAEADGDEDGFDPNAPIPRALIGGARRATRRRRQPRRKTRRHQ